jgi:hypothetical protein
MVRSRLLLVVLGGCLLGASAVWADDLGYIDCTNHPEETQVAAKAAKTQEAVGSMPCGERFTILQSGFFFTRIQTKEGKVGYVYTNLISHDYSASAAPQPIQAPVKMAARSNNPLSAIASAFRPKSSAPAESLRVPPPPAATPATTAKPKEAQTSAVVAQPAPSPSIAPAQPNVPVQAQPAQAQATATQHASLFPAKSGVIVLNDTVPPVENPVTPTQVAATKAPLVKVGENFPVKSAVVVQSETTPPQQIQSEPARVPAAKETVATDNFPAKSAVVVQSETASAVQTQPEQMASVSTPAPIAGAPEPSAAVVPSQPSAEEQPSPDAATPAASAFKAENSRPIQKPGRWSHRQFPLIELFGGYSFARLNSGAGTFTNYNGGMGAFGLNAKPWLQFVGDSSYNMIQSNGTKIVLYGNHYGARVYWQRRNRWSARPFVEGLLGGTRLDTTVSGTGGYSASSRVFSFKVGGGVDIRPSRFLELRLVDADYYRTSFTGGPTPYQSNYWISTGVVLRLFGGSE